MKDKHELRFERMRMLCEHKPTGKGSHSLLQFSQTSTSVLYSQWKWGEHVFISIILDSLLNRECIYYAEIIK